jgi:hypothetical protein
MRKLHIFCPKTSKDSIKNFRFMKKTPSGCRLLAQARIFGMGCTRSGIPLRNRDEPVYASLRALPSALPAHWSNLVAQEIVA